MAETFKFIRNLTGKSVTYSVLRILEGYSVVSADCPVETYYKAPVIEKEQIDKIEGFPVYKVIVRFMEDFPPYVKGWYNLVLPEVKEALMQRGRTGDDLLIPIISHESSNDITCVGLRF